MYPSWIGLGHSATPGETLLFLGSGSGHFKINISNSNDHHKKNVNSDNTDNYNNNDNNGDDNKDNNYNKDVNGQLANSRVDFARIDIILGRHVVEAIPRPGHRPAASITELRGSSVVVLRHCCGLDA